MNEFDERIRSTLDRRAQDAPPAAPVISRVLTREPRHQNRRGWLAAAAVATATAAIVAVGVTQVGGDNPGGESSGSGRASSPIESFTQGRVTYGEGSTIHYGDQTIDVSPHKVIALVQTNAGFVFVDQDLAVNFTDGRGLEQIGRIGGFTGDLVLAADDTGTYVGWMESDDAVVYDTASGAEVLREPVPSAGLDLRTVAAIDDGSAYVETSGQVDVWDLTTQTKTTITPADPRDRLGDVANGYLLWHHFNGTSVVSRDPDAEQPVFNKVIGEEEDQLSPDATYVGGSIWLFERTTQRDITPRDAHPLPEATLQWLDNDRYVADSVNIHTSSPDPDPHDLLICTASEGTCSVVAQSLDYITYPDGIANEGAREN
jgi:hypothetical protein